MIKYIKFAVSLLAILLLTNSESIAQETISLSECKQRALEHNQTLKSKQANYTASKASVKLSKLASLPNIDFDASYLYQNDPMEMDIPGFELPTTNGNASGVYYPGGSTNLMYHNTYSANVGMSLPIYLGGKINEAKKIAIHAKAIAESDIVLSQTNVLLSIEQQYWSLVSLIEAGKVNDKSIDFLSDVVTHMNNRYETGIVTKNEVLKAQVELNNVKLFQISLNDNIAILKMALNQSIGADINAPLNIADISIEISQDAYQSGNNEQNLNKRPEIAMLTKQSEILHSEKKIIDADYLPQLASFANYTFQNPNHLAKQEGELTWNAGLSLNIPIVHWGARKLKKTQAKMKIASTEFELDHTKELLILEINQARFKLNESLSKLQFTAIALEQAEENRELEGNRLKEEIATTTDLLNAQMQWQKAHSDYISAKANVKINEAFYKKAIGELNP